MGKTFSFGATTKVVGAGRPPGTVNKWLPSEIKWRLLRILADLFLVGCAVLGRGAEPPQFWGLLIWLEPGLSHVTWVHYDATMCLACLICSILPVLHFLRFGLFVL